ncbi:GIY-YIG nuclease family protein [Frigidibacter albus]|uniref:GIY-YIG nuclease family protein n=1 Tax=Frigidibacter albus TaxID=1465486 RepID=A0A6L8VHE4_9RHOB|nr:GIY-YIG nuclease family protein [Frigidibacter albus]NBE30817.1 GIY-YIG nuclease family protein [Frigidibacter albus]GGH51252.1 hypothetical protein GCM10011341_14790 [Frigidibacter albus]
MPSHGFIYIITNSADPSVVKVGRTNDLRRRVNQHNGASNVLGVWTLSWSMEVPDSQRAESLALASLSRWKVPGKREQFRCGRKKAEEEISVALAEWSHWGRKEKSRRKEKASREQAARRLSREVEEHARAVRARKVADERTFEMLCLSYPDRKIKYDRAKRILAGTERVPYPFKPNDLYLVLLLALGLFYFFTDAGPWEWARLPVAVAYTYGVFAVFESWGRFDEWQKNRDPDSQRGVIESFETVYPDGLPPRSARDLCHIEV